MNRPCEACMRRKEVDPKHVVKIATQRHHRFHDVKWARKLYPDYIDDPRNIEPACAWCNPSHASIYLTHWSENKFCRVMGIKKRSK